MKTFDEAFDALVNDDAQFTPREQMHKYNGIGIEILSSEKVNKMALLSAQKVATGELTLLQALRYCFGQGVLTGIEMEKP